MSELKPCPCGKTPTKLTIMDGDTYRWRLVSGNCCGEWMIEARVNYGDTEEEVEQACITYWNETVRG